MPNQHSILELDLKRHPIMIVNEELDNVKPSNIPQVKIDSFENAVKNTNLLEVVEKIKREKTTKK
ncbi:MAG: hypothetical protein IPL23_23120 [Saprospiraceae bacterium]|nr:hypothetical protein [Saprospiraceae bacterium]MBK8634830.1 hypothetical protein [Saprospiraceae bacterium]